MGYAGFSTAEISRALLRREQPGTGALALADAEGGRGHRKTLARIPIFRKRLFCYGMAR